LKLQINPFDVGFGIHLRLRRRVDLLVWARRSLWLITPLMVWFLFRSSRCAPCVVGTVVVAIILGKALNAWEQSLRRQFVRDAVLPRFLVGKLQAAYPHLSSGDCDLVMRGLRQFFMAHLRSNRKFIAMPSKVVDAAWHEFILHTRGYQAWCNSAFGSLLHHSPAEVLGRNAQRNDGLRRAWYWACKEESIDPRHPSRLPLLFALDRKFKIEGGFSYVPDCGGVKREQGSGSGDYCGASFGDSSSSSDGDAGGFGGSESSASGGADSGSDGGSDSGCGGGCGGD
jgi:hypothetical protein